MDCDICIYGGTASGVMAAVASARAGRSVILIEQGRHLGGMTSGGLGFTDIGNKLAIGGLSRDFYRRVGRTYGKDEAWLFEPHVAEAALNQFIADANEKDRKILVLLNHRIAEADVRDRQIRRIMLEKVPTDSANAPGHPDYVQEHVPVAANVFIDCGYEGDLMAAAKVSYTVGREAAAKYNEPLNGIRGQTPKHQFGVPVDPYRKPGDAASGLLPLIQEGDGGTPGAGDHRVQTYNFRLCLTQDKAKMREVEPQAQSCDPGQFELMARYLSALSDAKKPINLGMLMKIDRLPGGKTDINNNGAISTDFIGYNYSYPQGDYATRARIWHEHLGYTRCLLQYLSSNTHVPEHVRKEMSSWGLCRDEFQDTAGWPHQMYIREARRMVGRYVVTQKDCEHKTQIDDSIGLAAYNMDSHNCQRIVQQGVVRNEGDVQVPPAAPYSISYRALTPRSEECLNLLVPVCLSASHIAYGSIRMEPVFMLLGQSAAMAAALAIEKRSSVQEIDLPTLQSRLLDAGQILKWTPLKK